MILNQSSSHCEKLIQFLSGFFLSLILKEVTNSYFRVCIRDNAGYDGQRSNVIVNYLVIGGNYGSSFISWSNQIPIAERLMTSIIVIGLSSTELLTAQKTLFLCRNLKILTTKTLFVKKYLLFSNQSFNLLFNFFFYLLKTLDLHPCTYTICKYHSHCVASSPSQVSCVCESSCPSYEEQVCASNGRTFKNVCLLKQEICRTRGNYTNYHPGSCTGILLNEQGGLFSRNLVYASAMSSKTGKFHNILSPSSLLPLAQYSFSRIPRHSHWQTAIRRTFS